MRCDLLVIYITLHNIPFSHLETRNSRQEVRRASREYHHLEVRMNKFGAKLFLMIAVFALSAVALAGCGGGSDSYVDEGPATGGGTPRPTQPPSDDGDDGEAERELVVVMKDNVFEPKDLELKVGEKVTIVVKNQGIAVHNMHVLSKSKEGKDFSSNLLVSPGTEDDFEVQFKNAGTYDFQCDYHLPQMAGKIVVK